MADAAAAASAADAGGSASVSGVGMRRPRPTDDADMAQPPKPDAASPAAGGGGGAKRMRRVPSKFESGDSVLGAEAETLRVALERSKKQHSMANLIPLPDAPTYYPTEEQFADPCAYIASIAPEAVDFGICKIVPPKGWAPPSSLPTRLASSVKCPTRKQKVHRVSEGLPFPDGREYTALEYREMAMAFKDKHFPELKMSYASDKDHTPSSNIRELSIAIEQEYWRIVESGATPVDVEYANDLDTRLVGSGFPRPAVTTPLDKLGASSSPASTSSAPTSPRQVGDGNTSPGTHAGTRTDGVEVSWAQATRLGSERKLSGSVAPDFADPGYYARTGWNLNLLPFQPSSVLRHVQEEVNGVNVPWLYMGMLFTTFAWHVEDHACYSANYMHEGEGKVWYGVPSKEAARFERTVAQLLQDRFEEEKDLLFHITTMVSPAQLIAAKVPVSRVVQCPGEYVVTFPQAYHAGFSLGWNVAEACNFAMADWLPFGRRAAEKYRNNATNRSPAFSHDQLVCELGESSGDYPPEACVLIHEELRLLLQSENVERAAAGREGVTVSVAFASKSDPRYECARCQGICFLSAVMCRCSATRRQRLLSCLRHYRSLCKCDSRHKLLCYWYSLEELRALMNKVGLRAAQAPGGLGNKKKLPLTAGGAGSAASGEGTALTRTSRSTKKAAAEEEEEEEE